MLIDQIHCSTLPEVGELPSTESESEISPLYCCSHSILSSLMVTVIYWDNDMSEVILTQKWFNIQVRAHTGDLEGALQKHN